MSKLVALLSIPIGFALVRSITKNVKDDKSGLTPLIPPSPVTPVTPIVPVIPTPVVKPSFDIAPLIPEGAFKITPTQLEAFTPDRKVTLPKYDPGVPVAQPITQGKIKKFGTGVSLADLLARAR